MPHVVIDESFVATYATCCDWQIDKINIVFNHIVFKIKYNNIIDKLNIVFNYKHNVKALSSEILSH